MRTAFTDYFAVWYFDASSMKCKTINCFSVRGRMLAKVHCNSMAKFACSIGIRWYRRECPDISSTERAFQLRCHFNDTSWGFRFLQDLNKQFYKCSPSKPQKSVPCWKCLSSHLSLHESQSGKRSSVRFRLHRQAQSNLVFDVFLVSSAIYY